MATGTAGTIARQYDAQAVHFLRKSIAYTDDGKTLTIGTIPSGATIIPDASGVHVVTAFNGDTTNTLDIGYSTDSGTNNLATALDINAATTFVPFDEDGNANTCLLTADTIIQCYVVSTASASAGAAEVVIAYIPDTDG